MPQSQPATSTTAQRSLCTYASLAQQLVFDFTGIRTKLKIVRIGWNVVLADYAHRYIIRSATTTGVSDKMLEALTDLAQMGAPLIPPLVPYVMNGHGLSVTMWPLVPQPNWETGRDIADASLYGALLGELHRYSPPEILPHFSINDLIPDFETIDKASRYMGLDPDEVLPPDFREEMSHRYDELSKWSGDSPETVLHTDVYPGNVALHPATSEPVLIDLDEMSAGPKERDIADLMQSSRRHAKITPGITGLEDIDRAMGTYPHVYDQKAAENMSYLLDIVSVKYSYKLVGHLPFRINFDRLGQRLTTLTRKDHPWLPQGAII